MNDALEQMIEDSLARHAVDLRPGCLLDPAVVLVAGRRARRRRTGIVAAATVAALALGLAAAIVLPRATAPTIAPRPGPAGLDVLSAGHGIIVRGDDGRRIRIESPDADKVSAAIGVPGGWVAEADLSPTDRELLFVSSDGTTTPITTYGSDGGYTISPDGRLLVVTRVPAEPDPMAVAYDLPSLKQHAAGVTYLLGPNLPAGITGSESSGRQVILVDNQPGSPALIQRTGAIWAIDYDSVGMPGPAHITTAVAGATRATVLGVAADGHILRVSAYSDGHGNQASACVSVVPYIWLSTSGLRVCHPGASSPTGAISPDGTAIFLDGPPDFRGMYSYDAPGRFSARVALPAQFDGYHAEYGYNQQWIPGGSGARVVLDATRAGRPLYRYVACDVNGRCTPLAMPPGVDRPVPVAHLPG